MQKAKTKPIAITKPVAKTKAVSKTRTTFSLLDPSVPSIGLFRNIAKGRHKQTVDLRLQHGELEYEYVSPYILDHIDWQIFLAIAALCGIDGKTFDGDEQKEPYPTLWGQILPVDDIKRVVTKNKAIAVRTSRYEILKEAGLTSNSYSSQYGKLIDSRLKKMSAVTASIKRGKDVIFGLAPMMNGWIDEESGSIIVSLNPIMARPFLGEQYVKVSLHDMRKLTRPTAILLHGYLSARVRERRKCSDSSKSQRFQLDHLVAMVFGPNSDEKSTMSDRRSDVMNSIYEIAELNDWTVYDLDKLMSEQGDRVIHIMRSQQKMQSTTVLEAHVAAA